MSGDRDRPQVSFKFFSGFLGIKMSIYADSEDNAWAVLRTVVQPKMIQHFMLGKVEGSPERVAVRRRS